ncbi:MAG: helix-turn-helix domain-containing protein [Chloroflexota bacterium]|nr:MAG: hypothetical protein DLM70_05140 [Chloroflexota bacterium]
MDKLLLTIPEACHVLGIGRSHLYALLGKQLPVVRIGRSVRVHTDDVRRFAQEQRLGPPRAGKGRD